MRHLTLFVALAVACLSAASTSRAADGPTLLLRDPAVSADRIAFVYAGDLWSVDRNGGDPRRLTSDPASESLPAFSPDGTLIAFSRDHGDGNLEVYVMHAGGGTARRLTWHPGEDRVTGWSADGRRISFASRREVGISRSHQLWEIPAEGGAPSKVMEAAYFAGRWNGGRLAYVPFMPAYGGLFGGGSGWKGYRGGTSPSIHVMDPAKGELTVIPGERVNDIEPMWIGDALYFISDREDATFNVFAWDPASGGARRLTDEAPWDVRAADAHGDKIVYEAAGRLKELDVPSGRVRDIPVTLAADLPQTRPQWKDASKLVEDIAISPGGKRALVTARGEVFTVPVKHGSTRNITRSDGRREYTALWSPKGDEIAYVVQEDAGQALVLRDQAGLERERRMPLGPEFHRLLSWSPDGGRIAYADNRLNLWVIRVSDGSRTRVDTHHRRSDFPVDFSPDGRWLAYALERPNFLSDLMLRDLEGQSSTRLSDGMADVTEVAFSPDGKHLFFAASTNAGPHQVGLDLSSQEQNERRTFYAVVLASDGESPVAPRAGDEEAGKDDADADNGNGNGDRSGKDGKDKKPAPTRVDLAGITRRIAAIPIAERNYQSLGVAEDGDLLFIDAVQPGASATPNGDRVEAGNSLKRYDFEKREVVHVADGIVAARLGAGGTHLIVRNAKGALLTGEVKDDIKLEPLDTAGLRMMVDPRREWGQIFEDAVRMQPAYFYARNLHGLDWDAVSARYRPLLAHVGRREDLNDVIVEMIAELQAGHNRAAGGDTYAPPGEDQAGLLGADLRVEQGRWRIARILDGGSWDPFNPAPLGRPGLRVAAGAYILAINGQELAGGDNLHQRMAGTVGQQTTLAVADDPGGLNRRNVVVEPIASERTLRLWDWVNTRRARVEAATNGRVGYVYLPNTTTEGYRFFNRMFFAQVDKEAMIIDERGNGGGQAANYVTDVLRRSYLSSWMDRDGAPFDTPGGAMYGPKVMLIDQDAGSGGDFLPYAFRREGIGKLMGTRTWGGLIGIATNPAFVDGGRMTVPYFRFYTPEGEWRIENEGVAPDIEVRLDPLAVNRGEDTQLDAAIAEVMAQLATHRPVRRAPPPLPTEPGK
ncbi:MAG: PDZ domain-containing protein [Steroidobacteraceae bacterium]|jgi:tricorn protease|nr:PDZ domain-containing protein [Steroidobacteraceae bacterium]